MKSMKTGKRRGIIGLIMAVGMMFFGGIAFAESLVILHTNDTHSAIDPDEKGRGGVLQRKAIIDSIRGTEKNVILVDAGDIVQGSLYFKFFKGDVEYPLMNMMGYDIRVLGNHEFDNGLNDLAKYYKDVKGDRISANYDFTNTPLKGMFQPYVIKNVDGKKIGFIGINVDPESLISKHNYEGLKYKDIITTANETAKFLKKKKKCDLVVVVSHIGYVKESDRTTDVELAHSSRYIDIIIGGHSHTIIDPKKPQDFPCIVNNAVGKPVLIAQTGKYGKYLGYIKIDLDDLKKKGEDARDFDYELIPVTDRFPDGKLDKEMKAFLAPYRHVVDSVNHRVIGRSLEDLSNDERIGGYPNWISDFAFNYGRAKADSLTRAGQPVRADMGFMNVGGIRHGMPKGDVTEGEILNTFPFANRILLLRVKGRDIMDALEVAAKKGGEGVSCNVRVLLTEDKHVYRVIIDDEIMDPEKEYVVSTIDYVAEGNDDMRSWSNGEVIWRDTEEMVYPVLRYIYANTALGLPIAPDPIGRFQPAVILNEIR